MTQKKTILIIDDHPLFREGLRSIIKTEPCYEVIGEAGKGSEGLRLSTELKPDLAIVDLSLPDQTGIELTQDLRRFVPRTRILIVSMHSKIDYIVRAFQAGATGYVTKESASDRLLQAMATVLKDDYFMDESVSQKVVKRLVELPSKDAKVTDDAYDTLTPREQEIMLLLAEGLSPDEIGRRLFISPKTAENHRSRIFAKLGLHSTMELVRYAAKLGLIDTDLWKG